MKKLFIYIFLISSTNLDAQVMKLVTTHRSQSVEGILSDSIFVNIWDSIGNKGKVLTPAYNNVCWQLNSTAFSGYLKYTGGTASNIRVQFLTSSEASGATVGYNDNTQSYANNNTTFFNDTCLQSTVYTTTLKTNNNKIKISGLDNAKTYDIRLLFTRNTTTDRNMTANIGGDTFSSFNLRNNYSTVVTFDNKSPSSGIIEVTTTWSNDFVILACFLIVEKS